MFRLTKPPSFDRPRLARPRSTAEIGNGLGPADLDGAAIRVHMGAIDTWPNDLGRFALPLTGAHVSDPFSKIDQSTKGADLSVLKSYVYLVKGDIL